MGEFAAPFVNRVALVVHRRRSQSIDTGFLEESHRLGARVEPARLDDVGRGTND
jgi:hypothetical protein